jgi:hypothetical protein
MHLDCVTTVLRAVLWMAARGAVVFVAERVAVLAGSLHGVGYVRRRMISLLPVELQVLALQFIDSGARIAEWVCVYNTSKEMRGVVELGFSDWVAGQPLGTSFGEFGSSGAEARFVMDHINGIVVDGFYLVMLITTQFL